MLTHSENNNNNNNNNDQIEGSSNDVNNQVAEVNNSTDINENKNTDSTNEINSTDSTTNADANSTNEKATTDGKAKTDDSNQASNANNPIVIDDNNQTNQSNDKKSVVEIINEIPKKKRTRKPRKDKDGDVIMEDAGDTWAEPTTSKIDKVYKSFLKTNQTFEILNTKEDFNKWWFDINTNLARIGFIDIFNRMVNAKIDGMEMTLPSTQEKVIKNLLSRTVKMGDFGKNVSSNAQTMLYDILSGCDLCVDLQTCIAKQKQFRIDLSKDRLQALNEWEELSLCMRLSRYNPDNDTLVAHILLNFWDDYDCKEISKVIEGMVHAENNDIPVLIDRVHKEFRSFAGIRNKETVLKEITKDKQVIAGIKYNDNLSNNNHDENVNHNIVNKKRGNGNANNHKVNKRIKSKKGRSRVPKHCVICGRNHAVYDCPEKFAEGCWKCGSDTHNLGKCPVVNADKKRKQVNAILNDTEAKAILDLMMAERNGKIHDSDLEVARHHG